MRQEQLQNLFSSHKPGQQYLTRVNGGTCEHGTGHLRSQIYRKPKPVRYSLIPRDRYTGTCWRLCAAYARHDIIPCKSPPCILA